MIPTTKHALGVANPIMPVKKKKNSGVMIGIVCAVIAVLLIATVIIAIFFIKKKKSKEENDNENIATSQMQCLSEPTLNADDEDRDLNFWL